MQDIRWKQRFDNYQNTLQTLSRAVELSGQRDLSELELQGVIHGFEFTHELAWNYLEEQGFVGIIGSRNATREAWFAAADGGENPHRIRPLSRRRESGFVRLPRQG